MKGMTMMMDLEIGMLMIIKILWRSRRKAKTSMMILLTLPKLLLAAMVKML